MTKPILEIINPLSYPEWDNLVLNAQGGTIYHTAIWGRVLHDSYNYEPRYLVQISDGKLIALVPVMEVKSLLTGKRGVSLPFTDFCEPIISDVNSRRDILERLVEYGRNAHWKYLEFRGGEQMLGQVPSSSSFYRHVLKLSTNVDAVYGQLRANTRKNVKKAQREGVTITQSGTLDAVRSFYTMHCKTRKRHGVPPQPFHFFERIYDHVISRDHGLVALASQKEKIIAGAIYFHFGQEAIYKFGASDSTYLHLRPNDLLMWETIQWYCRNGFEQFCFGRTELDNEGLRKFKNGWGAKESVICYFNYNLVEKEFEPEKGSIIGTYTNVLKWMPIFLLKLIGKVLYRHVG